MNAHSVYTLDCECGQHIETASLEVTCPKCGVTLVLRWREEPKRKEAHA